MRDQDFQELVRNYERLMGHSASDRLVSPQREFERRRSTEAGHGGTASAGVVKSTRLSHLDGALTGHLNPGSASAIWAVLKEWSLGHSGSE